MILPICNESIRTGHVALTTARGERREVRTPSGHPPPCIVRSGELPPWPVPEFEGEHG